MGYLDRITKMHQNKGIRNSPKKFPWRGKELTILEIAEIWSRETRENFSPQKLRWRLTKTNNDIQAALEWKAPKAKVRQPTPLLCPDGIMRTRREIAEIFGLTKAGFEGRYARFKGDMHKIWAVGQYQKPPKRKKNKSEAEIPKPKKKLTAEQIRRKKALAKLPSPTTFEEGLWRS